MMFLTRLGENSRMVITGDPAQHDLPPGTASGLDDAVAKLAKLKGIGMIHFSEEDVVRHPLVARIIKAYRPCANGSLTNKEGDGGDD